MKDDYIRVAIRVRPDLYNDQEDYIVKVNGENNIVLRSKGFEFDKVFGIDSSQVTLNVHK